MDTEVAKIVTLAIVNESLTEYLFSDIPVFEKNIKKLAMIVGVLVALLFKADLFPLLGLTASFPIASQIMTGIIISRGSNIVNDLFGILKNIKDKGGVR